MRSGTGLEKRSGKGTASVVESVIEEPLTVYGTYLDASTYTPLRIRRLKAEN
jgi:hypothetical protein